MASTPTPPSSAVILAGCTQVSLQCPVEATQLSYRPNLGGNAFFLALFATGALVQLALGIRYKTWSFMIAMVLGCLAEVTGYAGRLILAHNPWNITGFEIEIILLIIAPVFLAAGIYLSLKHLVLEFGESYSLIRPAKLYTWIFISADIISLVMQGAGGALGASSRNLNLAQTGTKIALAGIIFQVVSLIIFSSAFTLYFVRLYRDRASMSEDTTAILRSGRFRSYIVAIVIAILTVLTRCIYRIPELGGHYRNAVFRSEIDFMVLDGAMIAIAVIVLTAAHPGYCFYALSKKSSLKRESEDEEKAASDSAVE